MTPYYLSEGTALTAAVYYIKVQLADKVICYKLTKEQAVRRVNLQLKSYAFES